MITITVYGTPGPQGSKKHVGKGIMVESSAKVKPWREAVKLAAMETLGNRTGISGPVCAAMTFTLKKPTSAPKKRKTWPSTKPDLSKLARSTEDALSEAGAWEDDARVVKYAVLEKVYPGEEPNALHVPGVFIQLWSMEEWNT